MKTVYVIHDDTAFGSTLGLMSYFQEKSRASMWTLKQGWLWKDNKPYVAVNTYVVEDNVDKLYVVISQDSRNTSIYSNLDVALVRVKGLLESGDYVAEVYVLKIQP